MTPEPHWLCPPSAGWMGQWALHRDPGASCRWVPSGSAGGAFSLPPDPCPPPPGRALLDGRNGGPQGGTQAFWLPTHTHKSIPRACHSAPRGGVPDSGPRAGSRLPSPRPFLGHSSHEAPQSACLLPHPGTSLPTLTEGSPREGTRCQGHGTGGDTRLHSLAPGTCSGSQPRRGGSGQDHKRSLGREARAGGGLASTVTYKPLPTPQLPSSHLGPSAWPPALGRQRLQKQTQRGRRRPQALLGDAGEGAFLL